VKSTARTDESTLGEDLRVLFRVPRNRNILSCLTVRGRVQILPRKISELLSKHEQLLGCAGQIECFGQIIQEHFSQQSFTSELELLQKEFQEFDQEMKDTFDRLEELLDDDDFVDEVLLIQEKIEQSQSRIELLHLRHRLLLNVQISLPKEEPLQHSVQLRVSSPVEPTYFKKRPTLAV